MTKSAIRQRERYRDNEAFRLKSRKKKRERYRNDEDYRRKSNERSRAWYASLKQDPERYRAFLLRQKLYIIRKDDGKEGKDD